MPGMDTDDIFAEMIECLWRAHCSFRISSGISIERYWWSIWMNRKADLVRRNTAMKRDCSNETLVDDVFEEHHPLTPEPVVVPAPTFDSVSVRVWSMLADGYGPKEVMARCGISQRRFYEIVRQWRTAEIREALC